MHKLEQTTNHKAISEGYKHLSEIGQESGKENVNIHKSLQNILCKKWFAINYDMARDILLTVNSDDSEIRVSLKGGGSEGRGGRGLK